MKDAYVTTGNSPPLRAITRAVEAARSALRTVRPDSRRSYHQSKTTSGRHPRRASHLDKTVQTISGEPWIILRSPRRLPMKDLDNYGEGPPPARPPGCRHIRGWTRPAGSVRVPAPSADPAPATPPPPATPLPAPRSCAPAGGPPGCAG